MQNWRQEDQVGESVAVGVKVNSNCRTGVVAVMEREMVEDTFIK